MCGSGQPIAAPGSMAEALAMADAAVGYLAGADLAGLPVAAQGEALLALERLDGKFTAAHAKLTAGFATAGGPQADGSYSAKTWLRQHARLTAGAAGTRVNWARRLATHPPVAAALAAGDLSPSWARQVCDWTGRLAAEHRGPADEILVLAAGRGASLGDLAVAAEEIHRKTVPGGAHDEAARMIDDRNVYLGRTLGGAARLEGDLTPAAAEAVSAVLQALGGRAGPEDHRGPGQRNHDALAEGCRQLIAAGRLPERAGQDTRAEVAIPLAQLRALPHAAEAEDAWIAAVTGAGDGSRLTGPEAAATACDTTVVPIVTGHLNPAALDRLTSAYLAARSMRGATSTGPAAPGPASTSGECASAGQPPLPGGTRKRLQAALLRWAIDAVSGPGGLASHLRTTLLTDPHPGLARGGPRGPLAAPSLPLDIGRASDIIPAHLRRAVIARDRHCAFPGCAQPPAACHVHHLVPRSQGGPTALRNLGLFCGYHHLIVIHTWGWTVSLNADGTMTANSPDGRTLHSHDPPSRTA